VLIAMPPEVLVGAYGGGSGALAHAPRGGFVGADAGWATMLATGGDEASGAPAFGLRAGWQWASGIALEGCFDDLGASPPQGGGPLLVGSGGVRYSVPLVVMPYAEVLGGAGFYGAHVSPTGGLGLGVSVPVLRHLMLDVGVRDWIADIDGHVRHVPTAALGFTVGFEGR
jgi:hypothetical protein